MNAKELKEFEITNEDGKMYIKHPNCEFKTELVDKFPTYHLIKELQKEVERLKEEIAPNSRFKNEQKEVIIERNKEIQQLKQENKELVEGIEYIIDGLNPKDVVVVMLKELI